MPRVLPLNSVPLPYAFFKALNSCVATGRHLSVAVVLEPSKAEEVSHHQFGHTLRRRCRGVEHSQTLVTSVLHIDVVHPYTTSSDEFEAWTRIDQWLSDLGRRAHKNAVNVVGLDERFELFGLHKVGVEGVPCFAQRLFS